MEKTEYILKIAQDLDSKKLYSQSNMLSEFTDDLSYVKTADDYSALQKKYASFFRTLKEKNPEYYDRITKTSEWSWVNQSRNWLNKNNPLGENQTTKREQGRAIQQQQRNIQQKDLYKQMWDDLEPVLAPNVDVLVKQFVPLQKMVNNVLNVYGPNIEKIDSNYKIAMQKITDHIDDVKQKYQASNPNASKLIDRLVSDFVGDIHDGSTYFKNVGFNEKELNLSKVAPEELMKNYNAMKQNAVTGMVPQPPESQQREYGDIQDVTIEDLVPADKDKDGVVTQEDAQEAVTEGTIAPEVAARVPEAGVDVSSEEGNLQQEPQTPNLNQEPQKTQTPALNQGPQESLRITQGKQLTNEAVERYKSNGDLGEISKVVESLEGQDEPYQAAILTQLQKELAPYTKDKYIADLDRRINEFLYRIIDRDRKEQNVRENTPLNETKQLAQVDEKKNDWDESGLATTPEAFYAEQKKPFNLSEQEQYPIGKPRFFDDKGLSFNPSTGFEADKETPVAVPEIPSTVPEIQTETIEEQSPQKVYNSASDLIGDWETQDETFKKDLSKIFVPGTNVETFDKLIDDGINQDIPGIDTKEDYIRFIDKETKTSPLGNSTLADLIGPRMAKAFMIYYIKMSEGDINFYRYTKENIVRKIEKNPEYKEQLEKSEPSNYIMNSLLSMGDEE